MHEALAAPEQNTDIYQTKDVVSLLVNSFRFSRGNAQLQNAFLSFIGEHYKERFGEDGSIFENALEPAQDAINHIYVRTHIPTEEQRKFSPAQTAIGKEAVKQWRDTTDKEAKKFMSNFQRLVEEGSAASYYKSQNSVAMCLVSTDWQWLQRAQEGTGSHHSHDSEGSGHVFSSNLVVYGLLGRPTGRQEFDSAFETATQLILNEPDRLWFEAPDDGASQIRDIIGGHLTTHPEDEQAIVNTTAGTHLETLTLKKQPAAF
jgi:hypothetical protein